MNDALFQVIHAQIIQSREEGLEKDDIQWMAQGTAIRYGREQGIIGDEISPEMYAAISTVVSQELKK